jgi:hypothetical protein
MKDDRNIYLERLARADKKLLHLYLTRAIENDGTIVLSTIREKVTGYVGICSTDPRYIFSLRRVLQEIFKLPATSTEPDKRNGCREVVVRLTPKNLKTINFLKKDEFLTSRENVDEITSARICR